MEKYDAGSDKIQYVTVHDFRKCVDKWREEIRWNKERRRVKDEEENERNTKNTMSISLEDFRKFVAEVKRGSEENKEDRKETKEIKKVVICKTLNLFRNISQ